MLRGADNFGGTFDFSLATHLWSLGIEEQFYLDSNSVGAFYSPLAPFWELLVDRRRKPCRVCRGRGSAYISDGLRDAAEAKPFAPGPIRKVLS